MFMKAFRSILLLSLLGRGLADLTQAQVGKLLAETQPDQPGTSSCKQSCSILNIALPGKVSFPNSTIYDLENAYWSEQQAEINSTCRVTPTSSIDVSLALYVLEFLRCEFAVKSGGHAAFAGASNIKDGVTIDMANLNEIVVSKDQTVTSLGPGNRWVDVYTKLEPLNLSVVGGRTADIGVGGLLLGGGISFFSQRFGFACDNVLNYEVVFADGTIRDVNFESYPDLYWALRGGGNNFGIVTRFDVFTFPQGNLWGGANYYTIDKAPALINAFSELNINSATDPYATVILAFGYVSYAGWLALTDLEYGKPIPSPPIFENFTSITPFESTMAINSLSNLTLEIEGTATYAARQTMWSLTFHNDANFTSTALDICMQGWAPTFSLSGISPSCIFQPISTDIISQATKRGGNAFGLSPSDGPLTLMLLGASWALPSDDAAVLAAAQNIVTSINSTAYQLGLGHRYIYQNYASAAQNVFWGYGEENLEKLKAVSKKYDPTGVFEKLQPGYFKL